MNMASDDEHECFWDAEAKVERDDHTALASRVEAVTCMDAAGALQLKRSSALALGLSQTTTSTIPRPHTSDGLSTKTQQRHSLQESIPAIPAIPARFLDDARRASLSTSTRSSTTSEIPRRRYSRGAESVPAPTLRVERPQTSRGRNSANTKSPRSTSHGRGNGVAHTKRSTTPHESIAVRSPERESARQNRRSISRAQVHEQTLARLETPRTEYAEQEMARRAQGKGEDLFLELAQDGEDEGVRPPSRSERVASRLSHSGKRRSLPADSILTSSADRRPKSSGNIMSGRPPSRQSTFPSEIQRHMDRYRNAPNRAALNRDDSVSVSGRSVSGRANRYSVVPERSPISPSRYGERMRSPELPAYGRGRPSFGAGQPQTYKGQQTQNSGKAQDLQDGSPADSSEPKQSLPDSASVDSQTDTVWDELDDLKSRIKKLELTGKLPPSSGAAVSGDSSERPRTATTAPTTIESSPRHEHKPEQETKPAPTENTIGGPNAANIHPLLHAALAKAKPLLNSTLYRSLEATAADALQLAALTGSAGPQGTTFSAASIINGVTVSDRHVRRKADTMCRNLTDLCLALCEGKHEAPSVTASPVILEPIQSSPTIRYSRSSIGSGDNLSRGGPSRAVSRLEARRTSILGARSISNPGTSPRESADEVSASEPEGMPSQPQAPPKDLRRVNRASSRLLSARMPRHDETSGDEDPTIRPPSRATTDIGTSRLNTTRQREYNSPGAGQHNSPNLRDSLAVRRANASAYDGNRDVSRVTSMNSDAGGRRRWDRESTPPVLEEEGNDGSDHQPASSQQPRRRITSLGQFSARRAAAAELPSRAASLSSRRHVVS